MQGQVQGQNYPYSQQGVPAAAPAIVPAATGPVPYSGPRSQRSIENLRAGGVASPSGINSMRSLNGVVSKMDSPANAPQDGFHYNRTTSPPGTNGYMSPPPVLAEVDAMRKREAWYKAALALAVKKGFVEPEQSMQATSASMRKAFIPSDSAWTVSTRAPREATRIVFSRH